MALTDVAIRKSYAKDKAYFLTDERGLYVEVRPTGRKFWRLRIWTKGKETKKTLGEYPYLSLKDAREMRDRIKAGAPLNVTFRLLAEEWLQTKMIGVFSEKHVQTVESRLKRLIYPAFADRPLYEITAPEILGVLRGLESQKKLETAKRVNQIIGQILRYGVATGRCDRDLTQDLKGALRPPQVKHMPTITSHSEIGALMRSIDSLNGQIRCALLFQIYTAVRPGELRRAEWSEIENDLWRIPMEKMKMRRMHYVPLSHQALDVLEELHVISGHSRYLFPSIRSPKRPMSDATVNAALRRLGYAQEEMTGHGFRSMFSTVANENNWPPDIIERQLAHVDKNTVRAAYNHAEYMPQRRELLQWWADWLDGVSKSLDK